jgi:peptide/nickel transport system substrate-binding protein
VVLTTVHRLECGRSSFAASLSEGAVMRFSADSHDFGELTRRDLIARGAGAGAALALGGGLLAACGSGSSSSNQGLLALPGGTPKRGGTFTVVGLTDGSAETVFPGAAVTTCDCARIYGLFEPMFKPGVHVTPLEPCLALSAEPNATATKWTFHLRPGVTWHDGKPLTADDLVYNFHSVWSVPTNIAYGLLAGITDFKSARKVGPLAVEVSLTQPIAEYASLFATWPTMPIQTGATQRSTERHPIGTGPFKFVSFTPGRRSEFKANPDYWQEGKPYVDTLVVNSSFTDAQSAFNAVLSGQANLCPGVLPTIARQQLSAKKVQILESPPSSQSAGFCMRVDKGPFTDNRVRTAFKLLVDRQALIEGAMAGFGSPGADIPGYLSRYYATDLKRTQDVEQARSLFKAAGVLGNTYTLQTSAATVGQVESATLFAAQAAAAGVNVKLQTVSVSTYFTPPGGYLTRPFGQELNQTTTSLTAVYRAEIIKGCPYSDTHWGDGPGGVARSAPISAAIAEPDPSRAKELWHRVQESQFNEGGYIWWSNFPFVDAAALNVRGLTAGAGFNYNNFGFADGWLD